MTNKDRFLRDGVSVEEVANEFEKFCVMLNEQDIVSTYKQEMKQFLNCEINPKLTEDEIAILRNIPKEYEKIRRIEDGEILYLEYKHTRDMNFDNYFHHLFQFIKNGEEYEIEELLK